MTTQFKLFTTSSCHLCEEATAIVSKLKIRENVSWLEIEIADDDALLASYGIRIPVLRHLASGKELNWPFTEDDIIALLRQP